MCPLSLISEVAEGANDGVVGDVSIPTLFVVIVYVGLFRAHESNIRVARRR